MVEGSSECHALLKIASAIPSNSRPSRSVVEGDTAGISGSKFSLAAFIHTHRLVDGGNMALRRSIEDHPVRRPNSRHLSPFLLHPTSVNARAPATQSRLWIRIFGGTVASRFLWCRDSPEL